MTNISPSFLRVWKPFLWAFSPFLKYIYLYILNLAIFFQAPFLPPSLRYRFKATSRFYKVNPLLQRSDQIRVHAAPCPPLHSAPAPRSLCLRTNDLYTHIYIFGWFVGVFLYFFFRASCMDRLRATFAPPESLLGQHRPDNTCSSELLLL